MNEIELKNKIQSLEKDEIWEVVEECVDQLVYNNPVLMEQAYKNVCASLARLGFLLDE